MAHAPMAARRGAARATTWWGKAWVRAVEEAAYTEGDLRRGRALSRAGTIGGITVLRGGLVASVSDDRGLFTAAIGIPQLDDGARDALVEAVSAEAGRIGALLVGDLPHALVEHAEEAGVELLPFGAELEATCTCDGWPDPCPHALALLYQTTWLLETDPLTLLHLRGLPRSDLLARLHDLGSQGGPDVGPAADEIEDAELDTAVDAALRAARVVELLDGAGDADSADSADSAGPVEHLL